jgi:hypothetical protein
LHHRTGRPVGTKTSLLPQANAMSVSSAKAWEHRLVTTQNYRCGIRRSVAFRFSLPPLLRRSAPRRSARNKKRFYSCAIDLAEVPCLPITTGIGLADHDRAVLAGIDGDLARRVGDRFRDNLDAVPLVFFSPFSLASALTARNSATPPPGKKPFSTAGRVACIASSTRSPATPSSWHRR